MKMSDYDSLDSTTNSKNVGSNDEEENSDEDGIINSDSEVCSHKGMRSR